MNIDWAHIRSQLGPSVTPVNIGLTLILFLIKWPLAILMAAYMFAGQSIGLDLRQPSTIMPAASNLVDAAKNALGKFTGGSSQDGSSRNSPFQRTPSATRAAGGEPDAGDRFDQVDDAESRKLKQERAALERERQVFEAEKRAFEESKKQATTHTE